MRTIFAEENSKSGSGDTESGRSDRGGREEVADHIANLLKLRDRTMGEAVDGFLSTVVSVKRMDIKEAAEEFIAAEDPRTKASEGQRAQLSAKYAYKRAIMLRRFAGAFPGHAVCDLAKEHLDAFIAGLAKWKSKSRNGKPVISAKGRNHHRAAIRNSCNGPSAKTTSP